MSTASALGVLLGYRVPVARVFLSHAGPDKPVVRRIAAALRVAGHDPWLDEDDILVGESIPAAVERGLRDADFVVLCLSRVAAERGWVEAERDATLMQQFREREARILPVRLEDVTPPGLVRPLAHVDLFPDEEVFERGIARLTKSIEVHQARRAGTATAEISPRPQRPPPRRLPDPGAERLATAGNSPAPRTRTFVGRDKELDDVAALLTDETDVQLRAALDGLPGIGKTELARQVVARLEKDKKFPGGIFWFDAEHPDLRLQWAKVAEDAGGPDLPDLDARAAWAVRQVAQQARRGAAILIVLDNVETWAPAPGPLPDVASIRMLVTTRKRWLDNSFHPYEVPPLDLAPARELLHKIVGRTLPGEDDLLRELGGHVLSIEIAATYLREYGTSPADYLRQLAAGKSPGTSVADRTAYRATAEIAFSLLWQQLGADVRGAWVVAAQLPPVWFSSDLADAIGLHAERRRALVRLHILDRDDEGRYIMHRLLREFALAEAPPTDAMREEVIRGAAKLLNDGDQALTFQRYRRDADSFAHLAAEAIASDGARLGAACAYALRQLGAPGTARMLLERALASDLKTYGEDHPMVATDRNNLALVLRDLGELAAARQLFEQVLMSGLKSHGGDRPVVATRRSNLAAVLRDLGELPAARQLFEQALASDLKTYGEDHPEVATDRNNLALVLRDLGELAAARQLFEQALASDLKTYSEDHPEVATDRNNLARVLQDLGELAAARQLFEQALASDLKTYGEDHPMVATRRNNLAAVLRDLGELPAARQLFEQALASLVAAYGDSHWKVVSVRTSLAALAEKLLARR